MTHTVFRVHNGNVFWLMTGTLVECETDVNDRATDPHDYDDEADHYIIIAITEMVKVRSVRK